MATIEEQQLDVDKLMSFVFKAVDEVGASWPSARAQPSGTSASG